MSIDWCCFYHLLRNSLVALLEALFALHVACSWMCVLFYFSVVCLHVCAYALRLRFIAGAHSSQALPGYLITARVPALLGALAVWQHNKKKFFYLLHECGYISWVRWGHSVGLVWSGYMESIWNGVGQRVRPSVFWTVCFSWLFSRISSLCGFAHSIFGLVWKTHDFSFVSIELHPRLFAPCLIFVYHHLDFESISRNQTQIINVEKSPYQPETRIVIVALGNCILSSWIKSATKIPTRVGLNLLLSGTPRRMSTLLLLGIRGWKTRTIPMWNRSLRCFHIRPTILSLHSRERSFSRWMLGNVVER